MKIHSLKINAFGKLENKEIKLNNGINIIYGKNESGKSTLLKFISAMFFGLSKNKNGKEISDLEKYTPWGKKEISGKIIYELDNKNQYEVFREFHKKNIKIFNYDLKDISNEFTIDKNENHFFTDQTKLDEDLFFNTGISMQEDMKLDKSRQTTLIQKISNFISSGDDNISLKKTLKKLNDRILQEIGTNRTEEKPLNKIEGRLNELNKNANTTEEIKNKINNIEEEKNRINKEMEKQENEVYFLKKIKIKNESENIENAKIEINKKLLEENDNKILELKNKIEEIEKKEIKNNKVKSNKISNIIFIILLLMINSVLIFLYKNKYILISTILLDFILTTVISYYLFKNNKTNNNNKIVEQKIKDEINKITKEIEIIEENKYNKNNEINKIINEFYQYKENGNKKIIEENKNKINTEKIKEFFNLNNEALNNKILELENNYNNNKIKLHTLELDKKNILPELENQISKEEEKEYLEEQKKELNILSNAIYLAKTTLEESYDEMKQNIIPQFTEDLSKLIMQITDGKYKKTKYNDEQGLIVELKDGNYVSSNLLSVGTIDQMYLALRLLATKEITNEKMPIILDEPFAMADDERLKNIFLFLNDYYKENQKLIFTCTTREKQILDELNMEYHYIEM